MIKIKKLAKVFLLLTVTVVSLPAVAGYFFCPKELTCDLNFHGSAICNNTPSGWYTNLAGYTPGTAPLPASQVHLYFISAQNFPTEVQSNCNYYFITDKGGEYNVLLANNTGSFYVSPGKGIWTPYYPYSGQPQYYGCYSGSINMPTTEGDDPNQCPLTDDSNSK